MGCSNPHPHGQIWANESIPSFAAKKVKSQGEYFKSHSSPMLMDYMAWELAQGERIIHQNEHFVSLVPFWAVWPFEAMIIPKRVVQCVSDLSDEERLAWAAILKDLAVRFDNIFECSFPYSMGINQRPTDGGEYPGLVVHQSFYPPLLRNALVKKFQVGYEMSGEPQRDITQEQAANRLRDCGGKHYKCR
jgi:UDPglucose--hexose-1-phosphate uridylyltransferase